ncbi:hypothetical protein CXG81DRAFT_23089 [Caulochytrium protostelioides]|uniref:Ubiquitin-like domain-containing protein n=1 Tax=Caulochytrium protostelioides TaxID=1555241 RepID=A0A4P9XFH2_9FUNG|nr:hypothetical protein CXG81DRAFT_23089 [Caulochytrium protostelioides]|eukprot:RKP04314.1 hypothetical protein CXG81DRAFT_23089 [Caulochytrium protostelioides]
MQAATPGPADSSIFPRRAAVTPDAPSAATGVTGASPPTAAVAARAAASSPPAAKKPRLAKPRPASIEDALFASNYKVSKHRRPFRHAGLAPTRPAAAPSLVPSPAPSSDPAVAAAETAATAPLSSDAAAAPAVKRATKRPHDAHGTASPSPSVDGADLVILSSDDEAASTRRGRAVAVASAAARAVDVDALDLKADDDGVVVVVPTSPVQGTDVLSELAQIMGTAAPNAPAPRAATAAANPLNELASVAAAVAHSPPVQVVVQLASPDLVFHQLPPAHGAHAASSRELVVPMLRDQACERLFTLVLQLLQPLDPGAGPPLPPPPPLTDAPATRGRRGARGRRGRSAGAAAQAAAAAAEAAAAYERRLAAEEARLRAAANGADAAVALSDLMFAHNDAPVYLTTTLRELTPDAGPPAGDAAAETAADRIVLKVYRRMAFEALRRERAEARARAVTAALQSAALSASPAVATQDDDDGGGGGSSSSGGGGGAAGEGLDELEATSDGAARIRLLLRGKNGSTVKVRLSRDDTLQTALAAFNREQGETTSRDVAEAAEAKAYRVLFDGDVLAQDVPVRELDVDDDDLLELRPI